MNETIILYTTPAWVQEAWWPSGIRTQDRRIKSHLLQIHFGNFGTTFGHVRNVWEILADGPLCCPGKAKLGSRSLKTAGTTRFYQRDGRGAGRRRDSATIQHTCRAFAAPYNPL